MTDLADAPQTGGEEAASAPAPAEAAPKAAADAGKPSPSARDAFKMAMQQVEAREAAPRTETQRAAQVLKDGAGADERADETAQATNEASERAKKGWDTRRENAKAAETTEAKSAEVKPAEVKAEAPVEAAKPAEAPKVETAKATIPAPARLSKEAQAEWDKTPEPVRAEAVRAISELEKGLAKHKEGSERWTKLEPFEKMAKESYGVPLDDVLKNYIAIDQGLASDPLKTIDEMILKPMGYTLRQVAEHVLGQEAPDASAETRELRQTVAKLEGELKRINSTFAEQKESERKSQLSTVERSIEAFAREHPRYAELEPTIIKILNSPLVDRSGDPVADLKAAYETAERLNPAPVISKPAPDLPAPDRQAQTLKGQLSVSGAPGMGSNPVTKKPVPTSAKEAVREAFARLNIP